MSKTISGAFVWLRPIRVRPTRRARDGGNALSYVSSNTNARVQLMQAIAQSATGNALPILYEVLSALDELVGAGKPTVIDLGAIPFTDGDEKVLEDILGEGEVRAVLQVMGESLIRETSIPGVWRVDHHDPQGEVQSRFIEITFLPEILKTQPEDARRGQEMLADRLREKNATP